MSSKSEREREKGKRYQTEAVVIELPESSLSAPRRVRRNRNRVWKYGIFEHTLPDNNNDMSNAAQYCKLCKYLIPKFLAVCRASITGSCSCRDIPSLHSKQTLCLNNQISVQTKRQFQNALKSPPFLCNGGHELDSFFVKQTEILPASRFIFMRRLQIRQRTM